MVFATNVESADLKADQIVSQAQLIAAVKVIF
jgi:hypothetical protein